LELAYGFELWRLGVGAGLLVVGLSWPVRVGWVVVVGIMGVWVISVSGLLDVGVCWLVCVTDDWFCCCCCADKVQSGCSLTGMLGRDCCS